MPGMLEQDRTSTPEGRPPRIESSFFAIDPTRYFIEFSLDFGAFILGFVWLVNAASPLAFAAAYLVSVVAIHRASIFGHDIVHRYNDPRMKPFRLVWDFTVGAVCLFPVLRFYKPHITHHRPGIYRTTKDPQYPLLRHNPVLAVLVLLVGPLAMPVWSLFQVAAAALGGVTAEAAMERLFDRHGVNTANAPERKHRAEIVSRSRVYLALPILLAVFLPKALLLLYLVLAGGWLLLAWRIPLEHNLDVLLDRRSTWDDQLIDSYTIESPFADILQPHGMKYHTAHHLYPGVPYHNLPRLHAALTAENPRYRESTISLWDAICGGPKTKRARIRKMS